MHPGRHRSSVVANIVIPESLIRASKSSSVQHDVPSQDDEKAPGVAAGEKDTRRLTHGSIPQTPPNRSLSFGVSKPPPAHIEDSPGTVNPLTGDSPVAKTKPIRPDVKISLKLLVSTTNCLQDCISTFSTPSVVTRLRQPMDMVRPRTNSSRIRTPSKPYKKIPVRCDM